MDSLWEESMADSLKSSNINVQESYVDAVNNAVPRSITNSTVKCICVLSRFFGFNDVVTEKLYQAKKYRHYVVCKTLYHKKFVLDEYERQVVLWDTYLDIFSDTSLPTTREYMDNNFDLLNLIIEKKAYEELSNDRFMILSSLCFRSIAFVHNLRILLFHFEVPSKHFLYRDQK